MKNKYFLALIIIIISGLFASCQFISKAVNVAGSTGLINQNTANAISASADAIHTAAENITPEQEYYIGRAVAANILGSYKLWNGNSALTSYLNNICKAITINSPRPDIFNGYCVAILDSNEINAFATSGGHIFVTRGLISATSSEDALAGVIAHEVAHIQLMHGIKAIKNSRITQAIMTTASVGSATLNLGQLTGVFRESVGEIFQTMVTSGYSQSQEFDADEKAVELMASAGYNPNGLITMLNSLTSVQKSGSGFGKTHPTPQRRLSNVQRTVTKHAGNVADTSSSRQARFTAATR